MKAVFKAFLALAVTTVAMTCHASWTGPMIEVPANDNDQHVRSAKNIGIYHPTYIVTPEVCENFRKDRQCQQEARARGNGNGKTISIECERKHPWTNRNIDWMTSVYKACASSNHPATPN